MYAVEYGDGDKEELYHNEIHAHCETVQLPIIKSKPKVITIKSKPADMIKSYKNTLNSNAMNLEA